MKTPHTKYEKDFIERCKEFRLRLKKDQDGSPIVVPRGKKKKKLFHMGIWGKDLCFICVTAEHCKTKKKIISKFKDTKVDFSYLLFGSTECILGFDIKNLKKVATKFNLVKSIDKKLLKKEEENKA